MEKEEREGLDRRALERIGRFARRPLKPEEVYTFSVKLCDNEVDRELEAFDTAALGALAEKFIGVTGSMDHTASTRDQKARIYDCRVVEEPDRQTLRGGAYAYLKADCYMLRTPENAELIREIDGGINKEVSVGCRMGACRCSVCGMKRGACTHEPGRFYGEKFCCAVLSEPLDAYEWSFVAVPAQREAGVIKSYGQADRVIRETAGALAREKARYERERQGVRTEIARLMTLLLPDLRASVIAACSGDLRDESLDDVRKSLEKRAELAGLFAPQTAAKAPSKENESFKI